MRSCVAVIWHSNDMSRQKLQHLNTVTDEQQYSFFIDKLSIEESVRDFC
jgi:hypothetical protein